MDTRFVVYEKCMFVFVFLFISGACSLPDPSLFQKGSGSLYDGGVSAEELDSVDTGSPLEDTANEDTNDTSIDSDQLEDTYIDDTALEDSGIEDTAEDSDTGNVEE